MIKVTSSIDLDEAELQWSFIASPGPGGQNVNKVATTALLRFNVKKSCSLPEDVQIRMMTMAGKKLSSQGDLIIKASRFRTQERNKQDALNRLLELIRCAAVIPKKRKKTKPTFASKQRRLSDKKAHSSKKSLRRKEI